MEGGKLPVGMYQFRAQSYFALSWGKRLRAVEKCDSMASWDDWDISQ